MKIVILAGNDISTSYIFNNLNLKFNIQNVIIEAPINKKLFLKRRIKKIGIIPVIGQILFKIIMVPILRITSKKRINNIKKEYNLNDKAINNDKIINVSSVNSIECLNTLKRINPDIILVNGTRIISKKILSEVKSLFVNSHAGITPKYRGVHGAYWALVNNDFENCGVTIHEVDQGIDTGDIFEQEIINIHSKDNFVTLPFSQIGLSINLIEAVIDNYNNNSLKNKKSIVNESFLWSHPTIWTYLSNRIFKGVK